jgi:hypothetical protein
MSDDAFSIDKKEPPPIPHVETPEERHARLQKAADDIEKREMLGKIMHNPSSTEYEKIDAMDKIMSSYDEIYHPIKADHDSGKSDVETGEVKFNSDMVIRMVKELDRLTRGVTLVVREIDPEFY